MPHERNRFFTGREKELAALRDSLAQEGKAALTQVLQGLGGMGKTQVALEYAFRCREKEAGYPTYDGILWTRAETSTDLYSGYTDIARTLELRLSNPDDQSQVAADVRRWLETNERWLLVYDNADDPDLLEPFRPRNAKGHILLTSRAHTFRGNLGIRKPIELKSLPPDDAIRFLFDRTLRKPEEEPEAERQAASNLTQELGYFPLALEQAAAYIAAREETFGVYLADYRKRDQELLNEAEPETGEYRDQDKQEYKTVRTTWDLNLQAIEKDHPASVQLLCLSAFLAPDDIPFELVTRGASKLGSPIADLFADLQEEADFLKACDDLLAPLLHFSFIEKDRHTLTYSVHRMVQSVQQDRMKEQTGNWAERSIRAVFAAFPSVEFSTWPQAARFLPHAVACLLFAKRENTATEETAKLCNRAGYYLYERGLYAEAEPLFLQALEMRRNSLPEAHPDIAQSLNNLAGLYYSQGLYKKAEPLHLEALEIRRKSLPEGHPDIAQSLNNLAELYRTQGLYEKAEPLFLQALEIDRKALGQSHPDIASSLNALAELYRTQGLYEKAEPLFLQALEMRRNSLPEAHPSIATSLNNMALLYDSQGLYEKAEPLYLEALEMRRNSLPEGHPDIAQSLNNMAALYYSQGLYEKAEPLYLQALEIKRKSLPEAHPDIATSLNNLAELYRTQGLYEKAEPLYLQALEIKRKSLLEGHPDIASSLNALAVLYDNQGLYEKAEPLYLQALEIFVKAFGVQHPNTQIVLRNVVGFLREQGKGEEAEALMKEYGLSG